MEIVYHIAEEDFETIVERIIARLQDKPTDRKTWLTPKEALKKLNLTSKTSLYTLRMSGQLIYTQPRKRVILYLSASIDQYLQRNIKNSF